MIIPFVFWLILRISPVILIGENPTTKIGRIVHNVNKN